MKIRVFEYTRGDEWSVKCFVNEFEMISYSDLQHPEGISTELKEKFLSDAELAVHNKLYNLDGTYGHL